MADTVDTLLRRHSAQRPAQPMVIDPENQLSYLDLDSRSLAVAGHLINSGVNKGSRVGLLMLNGADWVLVAMAVLRIGAVLVPLSTLARPTELGEHLRVASVQFVITVTEFRGRRPAEEVRGVDAPSLQDVWIHQQPDDTADVQLANALTAALRPSDTLAIIFTSGSSGAPKGVIHSHANALSAVASGLAARCVTPDSRLYLPMPFFWVGGFGAGVLTALVAGATLVTEPIPQPLTTLRLLERERVTLFRGWPDQAAALARHPAAADTDLSGLQPGSLAALLPEGQRAAPGARANLFGMTESFGPYCGYPADTDMPPSAWGSCGKPFSGMDIRVVDSQTGVPVPTGTVGEIQLRGRHLMRGICGRSREDVFTADGYYPTGDLGHLDDEGFLFSHGRADDMFKVRGASVYPSEVERALRGLPAVRAAFVTNTSDGQVGAAVVADPGVTADALTLAAKAVLSGFKVPTIWRILATVDDVPRLASGKVDGFALRALLGSSPGATAPAQPRG